MLKSICLSFTHDVSIEISISCDTWVPGFDLPIPHPSARPLWETLLFHQLDWMPGKGPTVQGTGPTQLPVGLYTHIYSIYISLYINISYVINTCVYKYRAYPCKMRLSLSLSMAVIWHARWFQVSTHLPHLGNILFHPTGQGYSNDVSRCALDSLRSIVLRRCNHDSMKV